MASNRSTGTFIVLFLISLFETVKGYYCDNDKCKEEEFCCGENICCVSYKVWELWYFWCGILFCLLLLSLCACFWRQRSRAYWVFRAPGVPYNPLSVEDDPNYLPSVADPYIGSQKGGSLSPGHFYEHAGDQIWYKQHREGDQTSGPPTYTDRPYTDRQTQYYDDSSDKKADY